MLFSHLLIFLIDSNCSFARKHSTYADITSFGDALLKIHVFGCRSTHATGIRCQTRDYQRRVRIYLSFARAIHVFEVVEQVPAHTNQEYLFIWVWCVSRKASSIFFFLSISQTIEKAEQVFCCFISTFFCLHSFNEDSGHGFHSQSDTLKERRLYADHDWSVVRTFRLRSRFHFSASPMGVLVWRKKAISQIHV